MSPAINLAVDARVEDEHLERHYQKGVRYLSENGITKVPTKYILPISERPTLHPNDHNLSINLPIIDFAQLQGPNKFQLLNSLAKACQEFGFFQLINHGIGSDIIDGMTDVSRRFFELPFEEREKLMSADMFSHVRYGTSFNQSKDGVFCWRDFLKLSCHPLPDVLSFWPSAPLDFRQAAVKYSKKTNYLYLMLMEAILESLGVEGGSEKKELEDGSQLMVLNCYPSCPEPDLTVGMPPHSDYGLLTLLLQDEVEGLQIQHQGKWLSVQPIPNSFVVNVGDHLEIFSNGRYKSVLHRVLVNPSKSRISIASLHTMKSMVRPSPKLVNEANPRRYKDTDFATFLDYISSRESKSKNFLESRKLY